MIINTIRAFLPKKRRSTYRKHSITPAYSERMLSHFLLFAEGLDSVTSSGWSKKSIDRLSIELMLAASEWRE